MINCPDCRKEMSDAAPACPNCGRPNALSTAEKRPVGILLGIGIILIPLIFSWFTLRKGHSTLAKVVSFSWLAVFFLFVIADSGNKSNSVSSKNPVSVEPTPTETAIQVTSTQIARAYDQNEAKGDALYKGKLLHVTGEVTSIDKDFSDNTVIMLDGLNDFQNVHAKIKESEESKAIDLRKGEEITLQCRAEGEVVGSPMLNECTIL